MGKGKPSLMNAATDSLLSVLDERDRARSIGVALEQEVASLRADIEVWESALIQKTREHAITLNELAAARARIAALEGALGRASVAGVTREGFIATHTHPCDCTPGAHAFARAQQRVHVYRGECCPGVLRAAAAGEARES